MDKEDLRAKLVVSIVVTFLLLAASLFVILTNAYPETHSKWAFGMAGLILGYWLR